MQRENVDSAARDDPPRTGADVVLATLRASGIDTIFVNAGTSEIDLLAGLARPGAPRAVPVLFEGVATGAADGYARVSGRPAATLLHLGPGLANGLANLHNARRAHSPIVSVVGQHPEEHRRHDSALDSRLDDLLSWTEGWSGTASAGATGEVTAAAVAAAQDAPGRIATLVVPANAGWGPAGPVAPPIEPTAPAPVSVERIGEIAALLTGEQSVALLVDAPARHDEAVRALERIHSATGALILLDTFPGHVVQGGGLPLFPRLGYTSTASHPQFEGIQNVVLVGFRDPVSIFAYRDKSDRLIPDGVQEHVLAGPGDDATAALLQLASLVAPATAPTPVAPDPLPSPPASVGEGVRLDATNWAVPVAALLPTNSIVSDESVSLAASFTAVAGGARRHSSLGITGAAIGQGLPLAVGAAIAAPHRPVVALQADGSALYTIQALWTMARERLDVTVVLLNNSAYAILGDELNRAGAPRTGRARDLVRLDDPVIDFVSLSSAFGVPAERVSTTSALAEAFSRALVAPGPHLIDAILR